MSPAVEMPTYYDRWGPVARRMRLAGHYCRFLARTSLGLGPRILVEINWRLGDEIMALPIYEALKKRHPAAQVDVLCNYPELLDDNPHVDVVNPSEPSVDRYYLLRGAPRDAYRLLHYARQADVPVPDVRPALYYKNWDSPLLDELPPGDGPVVAVAAGATWETKRWPRERWRALCDRIAESGSRLMVLGQGEDESLGIGTDYVGRTSVREAATLLHHADVLVSNDSGLMHLGLAAGTPVVALFGPTDPGILIRDNAGLQVLGNERECRGCWNGSQTMQEPGLCPLDVDSCMGSIAVERVAEKVDEVLSGRG